MADLLSNGLHENVLICYIIAILLNVDLMYSLLRIPLEMVIGQQMKEEAYDQN